MASEILIKGMVCERCVSVIKEGVHALGYPVEKISLGKLTFRNDNDGAALERIGKFLQQKGFHVISNKQVRIVRRVKELIKEVFAENTRYDLRHKFSALLSEDLRMNYDSISELFTRLEGVTLEKYIIRKRLEKVVELLVYADFTLTEIAYLTGFSSINHLSKQFKQLTGYSPSHYKVIKKAKEKLSGPSGENLYIL